MSSDFNEIIIVIDFLFKYQSIFLINKPVDLYLIEFRIMAML